MTVDAPATDAERIAALERDNAKLRKINKVLMDRVERSMDFQGNAFALFQTAIVLENRVRERTQALEQALRELERSNAALRLAKKQEETAKQRLSEAIEAISEGFLLTDAADRIVLFNGKYREMLPGADYFLEVGRPFADVLRKAMLTGDITDALEEPAAWLERRVAAHRSPGEPVVIQFRDGRWVQVSERRTADGGVVGIYTDITEIKISEKRRRERELAEKSALLQATLDHISQGVCVFDRRLRLVAWNERFLRLLDLPDSLSWPGTPLTAFLGSGAMACQFPGDDAGRPLPSWDSTPLCMEHEFANGTVLEIRRNAMPDGGFVATFTDITERKRSEEALRDGERRIRLVTDAMPALIAYVDSEQRYCFTNKGYEDWFRRPRSEINGRKMPEVLAPDLYEPRRPYVERALAGEHVTFEMVLPSSRGQAQYALATYVPHVAANGEVLGFFALIQDITERKLAAERLRVANESLELRVAERTAALLEANSALQQAKAEAERANLSKTKFLAAASHDLLQPLNAARFFAAALGERRLSPNNRSLAENTLSALESVDEILNALLEISKLDAGVFAAELGCFPMGTLLRSMEAEYVLQARAKGLDLRIRSCRSTVHGDARLLGRVLRNFISNAIRYTRRGRILVGCRRRGDHVLIGVWDTGPGVPSNKLSEIFEEFRRLVNDGREPGVGLGLAIVKRIADRLGHEIVVRSVPGRGSMFGILVPIGLDAELVEIAVPAQRRDVSGARVMVIENDETVLRGTTALLAGWGCEILSASSELQALRVLAAGPTPDLVIADYHLDDGTVGIDVLRRLQARGPALPALVVTADHSAEVQSAVRAAGYHLLHKPVKPACLRSLMAHLLQRSPPGMPPFKRAVAAD